MDPKPFHIEMRLWTENQMVYPPSTYSSYLGSWSFTLNGLCYREGQLQDVTPLLYTGIKDVRGQKIYDGDIVQPCFINGSVVACVVTFFNGSFYVSTGDGPCSLSDYLADQKRPRVIGNIYEHPELMP